MAGEMPTNDGAQRRWSCSSARLMNNLPIYSSDNYSPHFALEFDLAVQNYCRQRSYSSQDTQSEKSHRRDSCDSDAKSSSSSSGSSSGYSSTSGRFVRNCKVVVSGDVAVGKTCLVNRFGHDTYSSAYQTTIGVDFDLQRFNILGQPYVLQIWDTAGLERFRCITNAYYRGCQVALLVFDMSNMGSLANVLRWKDEVLSSSLAAANEPNQQAQAQPEPPLLFLVGTKCDLPLAHATRAFIKEQANKVASLLKAELWFVSAQTGENVQELFQRVAALSFNRCILTEIHRLKFETSTLGTGLKEKIIQQQKELWLQSSKLIKISKKKSGDDKRSRCVNIQCVIK